MHRKALASTLRIVADRSVPGGGFSERPNTPFRADATAWAILALEACAAQPSLVEAARARLAGEQLSDGRVCLAKEYPHAYWPTSLATMAWNRNHSYAENVMQAVNFILKSEGLTFQKESNRSYEHDPSIPGWPWIEDTFSWVEPTALSIMALVLCGHHSHRRVRQAVDLLLDRQLPSGGWNIGSTVIYGQETYPQIDCTGLALSALAGQVEQKEIERSLNYLKSQAVSCRTPLSLGWALFGLGAWGKRPKEARRWVANCLSRQKIFGEYGTTGLSLLLLACEATGGFGFPEMIA